MMNSHADWIRTLEELAQEYLGHADVWCTLGQAFAAANRFAEARHALEHALNLNEQYVDAGIAMAFVLGDEGSETDGYAQFRRLTASTLDSFELVFAFGIYCMRFGWSDTGLAQLQRAVRMRPDAAYARLFLAAALREHDEHDSAREQSDVAQRLLEQMRDIAHCGAAFPDVAQPSFYGEWADPGQPRLHVQRANYLASIADAEAAQDELRVANSRYPGHPHLLVEAGLTYTRQDRLDEAEQLWEAAILADPDCHAAWFELSILKVEAGGPESSLECLQHAVELRPLYPDYRYYLGTLLLDLGKTDEAIMQLEQALILNPDHAHSALQLANAFALQERPEDARYVLENNTCRNWPEAVLLTAELLSSEGRPREARSLLEELLARDPDQQEARDALDAMSR